MIKVAIAKDAADFWKNLEPKQCKQIGNKIFSLLSHPFPTDHSHLRGYEGLMRVDSGEYRIIYKMQDDIIKVVLIGKRNDDEVYKLLKRKS